MSERHEIPTHLEVADRVIFGLTMRQVLTASAGVALAYGAWSDLPVPPTVRAAAAVVALLCTTLVVLWRPGGRPAEVWAFVLLRFWATTRVAVWRPIDREEARASTREVLLPTVVGEEVRDAA